MINFLQEILAAAGVLLVSFLLSFEQARCYVRNLCQSRTDSDRNNQLSTGAVFFPEPGLFNMFAKESNHVVADGLMIKKVNVVRKQQFCNT